MSSDKSAFPQSLVAMYGSSSESSEDEDSENNISQDPKTIPGGFDAASEIPQQLVSGSGDQKDLDNDSGNLLITSQHTSDKKASISDPTGTEHHSKTLDLESQLDVFPKEEIKPLIQDIIIPGPCAQVREEDLDSAREYTEPNKDQLENALQDLDVEPEDSLSEDRGSPLGEALLGEDESKVSRSDNKLEDKYPEVFKENQGENQEDMTAEAEGTKAIIEESNFEERKELPLKPQSNDGIDPEDICVSKPTEEHSLTKHLPSISETMTSRRTPPSDASEPETSYHSFDDSSGSSDVPPVISNTDIDPKERHISDDLEIHEEAQDKVSSDFDEDRLCQVETKPSDQSCNRRDVNVEDDDTLSEVDPLKKSHADFECDSSTVDPATPQEVTVEAEENRETDLNQKRPCSFLEKKLMKPTAGRRLRQIRHPSAKAAEAAADAAFVAAVTPTRKNLKEAKIACAIANVSDTADVSVLSKKNNNPQSSSRSKKSRSASNENSSHFNESFAVREDSNSCEKPMPEVLKDAEGTLTGEDAAGERSFLHQIRPGFGAEMDKEKPVGIKMKISRESVQILDPTMSKLEVQIPSESLSSEVSFSPGSSKRLRKLKDGTPSPIPPQSPITLKIAKSKEGLEVISPESTVAETEMGKIEKITLKLSKEDGATIVKSTVEDTAENRQEKITLKLCKDDVSSTHKVSSSLNQDDGEETKLGKITLKLSKGDSACIVKKKDSDSFPSSSDAESGKLERITLKRSTDNNVSIVRPKDSLSQLERGASASPELGKVEKITLKVSKNDNVSIVKPSSPTPLTSGVEKLTLKVCKDGTAAVSGRQYDEPVKDGENSKLEKITIKLSKDEGVSIVKPASPIPDKKTYKLKDEPLSPLSPLIISRSEDSEPQKERITLKLSKAGGHPSPVGVIDERSSWSIKSTDSDNVPSPVASDPSTPKSKPKRALSDSVEMTPVPVKRLKLTEEMMLEHCDLSSGLEAHKSEVAKEADAEDKDEVLEIKQSFSDPLPEGSLKHEAEGITEAGVGCKTGASPMEVIVLDSEDSQSGLPPTCEQSSTPMDFENALSLSKATRRKPRGRPRKTVLTPGAIPVGTPVATSSDASPSKTKREKIRPEPTESNRPKRVCKGREKPPPKPVKPTKPRGRAAAAKQKAESSLQPEGPQLFEEETRMSADCGSRSQTPAPVSISGQSTNGLIPKVVIPKLTSHSLPSTPVETPAPSPGPVIVNEESQGSLSVVSTTATEGNKGNRKGRMEINVDPDAQAEFTVDMVAEYTWPLHDGHGETYMIQEQISAFLGVKSFKRKYPNMQRRTVDHDERQYLLERKLVSESLCDLGLTALPSYEVLDVLCTDFPEKYEEYCRHTREKVQRELSNKQKAFLLNPTSGKEDSKSKAMRNMASFNAMLNRSRRDQRRACFDLQSFTVHYPEHRRRKMSVPNLPAVGAYPIALVPGQFTDFYKEYTATELRYFPLNTVLYGPLLPHEMMRSHLSGGSDGSQTDSSDSSSSGSSSSDSDSSGSDSDSDSDSSSDSDDDPLEHTGIGTMESNDAETDRPDAVCRVCTGDRLKNKLGLPEPLVHCASCEKSGHLSCLDLTVDMFPHIRKYAWHCTDCKLCAQCNDTADEDKMLFCDMCDRGYHIYCVGLRKVPEGRWHCKECALCASCGAREPGGNEEHQATLPSAPQDSPTKLDSPQWQHEFKKGDKGTRMYVRTLCVPCSKLWRKGRYCRLCWKCYSNQPEEEGLINCSICDRWMHTDCCRKAGQQIDMEKLSSYICDLCQQKGVRISANKTPSKLFR